MTERVFPEYSGGKSLAAIDIVRLRMAFHPDLLVTYTNCTRYTALNRYTNTSNIQITRENVTYGTYGYIRLSIYRKRYVG